MRFVLIKSVYFKERSRFKSNKLNVIIDNFWYIVKYLIVNNKINFNES